MLRAVAEIDTDAIASNCALLDRASGAAALCAVVLASAGSMLGLQRVWRRLAWGEDMTTYRPDDPTTGRGEEQPLPDEVRVPRRLLAPGAAMIALSMALAIGSYRFIEQPIRRGGFRALVPGREARVRRGGARSSPPTTASSGPAADAFERVTGAR